MSGRTRRDITEPDPQAAIKDPDDWVTGDEPWTAPQRSYLETLSREAGQDAPESLTKAEAAKLIEELQERTGRGPSTDQRT
ncbi:DUF3072 domain-containing protein [Phytohabitans houttuyneae]|uniref:DUF3072 domain-containing protein n=1 Tax=Phytohabitans houttuyneae TaxID=1076126 RepID=A0A6V8K1L2_9ACTN|nr:DUF3072 domain-containing protein [Phytohabitans houttuyneae]GFJ76261.1 hypothetical protein Phou_004410 [Phytohabitans houttuyneae]